MFLVDWWTDSVAGIPLSLYYGMLFPDLWNTLRDDVGELCYSRIDELHKLVLGVDGERLTLDAKPEHFLRGGWIERKVTLEY